MSRDDLSFENITFGPFIDSDYIKGVNPTQWEKIRELGDTQNSQERIENLLRVDQAVVISEDDFNQDNGIIQYALDKFKTVKLKDGTYRIKDKLKLNKNRILIGSQNTIIDASLVDTAIQLNDSSSLSNLTIDNAKARGIRPYKNSTIYRIKIKNTGVDSPHHDKGQAIYCGSIDSFNVVIVGVDAHNSYTPWAANENMHDEKKYGVWPSKTNGGHSMGFRLKDGAHNITFIDCHAHHNAGDGYDFAQRGSGTTIDDKKISVDVFYSSAIFNGGFNSQGAGFELKRGSEGEPDMGRGKARLYGSFAYGNFGRGIGTHEHDINDAISINNTSKNNFDSNFTLVVPQNTDIKDIHQLNEDDFNLKWTDVHDIGIITIKGFQDMRNITELVSVDDIFPFANSWILKTDDLLSPGERYWKQYVDVDHSLYDHQLRIKSITCASSNGDDLTGSTTGLSLNHSIDPRVASILVGGDGNDTIRGLSTWDIIDGKAGDDLIHGGDGRDFLSGGLGNDEIHGDFGSNTFASEKDGFKDLIVIKSDYQLKSFWDKSPLNVLNEDKCDYIEELDVDDSIRILGLSTSDLTFKENVQSRDIKGIGIYGKGNLEAIYTGNNLSINDLRNITLGDRSDKVLDNSFWSYKNNDVVPQITNKLEIKLDIKSMEEENPLLTLKINDKIYSENLEVIKDSNLTTDWGSEHQILKFNIPEQIKKIELHNTNKKWISNDDQIRLVVNYITLNDDYIDLSRGISFLDGKESWDGLSDNQNNQYGFKWLDDSTYFSLGDGRVSFDINSDLNYINYTNKNFYHRIIESPIPNISKIEFDSKQYDAYLEADDHQLYKGRVLEDMSDQYQYIQSTDKKINLKKDNTLDDITGLRLIHFQDKTVDVLKDIKGVFDQVTGLNTDSGEMYRLYNAAFARFPDADGLKYWIDQFSSGKNTRRVVAQSFLASDEFTEKYGSNVSDETYVNNLYKNVLGRDADTEGLNYWVGNLSSGLETRYEALLGFAESAENKALFTDMTGFG